MAITFHYGPSKEMAIETTIKPEETRHVENVVSPSTSTASAQERLEHSGPTETMPQPDEKITGKLILAFVVSFTPHKLQEERTDFDAGFIVSTHML